MPQSVLAMARAVLNLASMSIERAELVLPDRVFVAPGELVAWDDCCNGQLWARVITVAASTGTGDAARRGIGPDPRWQVNAWTIRLGIGHVMCAATLDDQGNPPTPAALTEEAEILLNYSDAIRFAIMCDLPVDYRPRPVEWRGIGPEGGCVGGEWTVDIEQPN